MSGNRKGDDQRFLNAIKNGTGALIARVMIIVGLPLISALAGYAFKVTFDNITLSIAAVAKDVATLSADVKEIKANSQQSMRQVDAVQNNLGRIDEHTVDVDRRLDGLERRK